MYFHLFLHLLHTRIPSWIMPKIHLPLSLLTMLLRWLAAKIVIKAPRIQQHLMNLWLILTLLMSPGYKMPTLDAHAFYLSTTFLLVVNLLLLSTHPSTLHQFNSLVIMLAPILWIVLLWLLLLLIVLIIYVNLLSRKLVRLPGNHTIVLKKTLMVLKLLLWLSLRTALISSSVVSESMATKI